jgi:uncharacterized protein (TIGR03000 family)
MLRRLIPVLSLFVLAVTALSFVTSEVFADRASRQARRDSRRGYTNNNPQQQPVVNPQQQPVVGQQPGTQPMPVPGQVQQGYRSYYRTPTAEAPAGAVLLNVQVPENAKVWIDGAPTTSTGLSRSFVTPSLTPGRQFTYEVKAQWNDGTQQVTRTRRIPVQAGQAIDINLQQPTQEELRAPRPKTETEEN